MNRTGSIGPVVAVALLGVACASSYYDTWTNENPAWFSTLPDPGTGLHETLAGLQAPVPFDSRQSISKLAVLRVSADSATELTPEQIDARLVAPPGDEDLAIVATLDCRSKIDMRMYSGQKVSWLLLEDGRLSAWDLHVFGSRCVVGNDFRPARRASTDLEAQVRDFRDAHFPRSMGHAGEYYAQGLVYAREGQLAQAEAMLEKGDGTFDVSGAPPTRFERPSDKVETADGDDDAVLRDQLVRAIDSMRGLAPSDW